MPPKELQDRTVGGSWPDFLVSGQETAEALVSILTQHGRRLDQIGRILDFGCGCARTLRFLMPLGAKTRPIGVDVDADQIHYCQGHLPSLGEYICIPHEPPMPFADGTFDCIYSISTFTHFTEPWQHHWLKELKRIAQPNALLILSIAGERNLQYLSTEQKAELNRAGFVCSLGAARGDHSPDYYHLAMHTYDYVRQVWSTYFEILDIVPAAINNNQAAVVCRVA